MSTEFSPESISVTGDGTRLRVSVVVPTYRRPSDLMTCLAALSKQDVRPEEIVVVHRADDELSASAIAGQDLPSLASVIVRVPGVEEALRAGFLATSGDIVAVTDDDAAPRPDWCRRIHDMFRDPAVGVVGGRDVVEAPLQQGPPTEQVGHISYWGRTIGNHHLGCGEPRDVEILKGVNIAFRRSALAAPKGLRGSGAQPHWEIAMCQWARVRGWRLVFDPSLLVDHYPAARSAGDQRDVKTGEEVAAEAYNLVTALVSENPGLLLRRALFGVLVGDSAVPGVLMAIHSLVRHDRFALARFRPSISGQLPAIRNGLLGKRLEMVPLTRITRAQN